MIAQAILPAADALPLPAPAPLLLFLLQLTFLLHILAMNAMLGGLLITLWARLKGRPGDQWTQLADTIAKVTPTTVAATVTLGVAPLLFLQTLFGQFFFTSSIVMGWGWFSVIVVLIFAYYGTYIQSFLGEKLGGARVGLLALTALLFLWVGFMFSNNTTLMLNVQKWAEMYFQDARGLHLNLGDPQLWPRFLHMVIGAVAVAGLLLAWWGKARLKGGDSSGQFMVHVGTRAWVYLTALNVVLGLWYYMALPGDVRKLFMGGSGLATALFGIGFVTGLLVVILGGIRLAKKGTPQLPLATALLLVQLVVMIIMRDLVRGGMLGDLYQPGEFVVQPQTLNLVLFAVLLVMGIAVVFWMVRKLVLVWSPR